MITEAELYNDKWRVRDNKFYKLGVYIIPEHSDVKSEYMWRFFIKNEEGECLLRSAFIPFENTTHLERVIKWNIQNVVFDPWYPVLAKLSPKLKRTLKNWIL